MSNCGQQRSLGAGFGALKKRPVSVPEGPGPPIAQSGAGDPALPAGIVSAGTGAPLEPSKKRVRSTDLAKSIETPRPARPDGVPGMVVRCHCGAYASERTYLRQHRAAVSAELTAAEHVGFAHRSVSGYWACSSLHGWPADLVGELISGKKLPPTAGSSGPASPPSDGREPEPYAGRVRRPNGWESPIRIRSLPAAASASFASCRACCSSPPHWLHHCCQCSTLPGPWAIAFGCSPAELPAEYAPRSRACPRGGCVSATPSSVPELRLPTDKE